MAPFLVLWCAALVVGAGAVDTQFLQVAPGPPGPSFLRTPGQARAVVLLHGLRPHPFNEANVHQALLDGWQKPGSKLVRALARDADVYAYAYSQNAPLDRIAELPALAQGVWQLSALGYSEIVLVGHSAGGVIARQFVEDHSEAGVTKVVQVSAPNAGSSWVNLAPAILRGQEAFVHSLSKEERKKVLERRAGKRIPAGVQFVCLVGTAELVGDGLVSCASQWPQDLQAQGIPVVGVFVSHLLAVRTDPAISRIAELARTEIPRWDPAHVAAARQKLLIHPSSLSVTGGRSR
jgi:pimeloyl-ACP methyl ester carboxylesterase